MDQASSSSDKKSSTDPVTADDNEEREAIEIALFQVPECYVYLIPPRKTAASYRNNEFAVVENPGFWNWTYTVKDADGEVLAQIDRDCRGFGFEMLGSM